MKPKRIRKPAVHALGFSSWLYSGSGKRVTLFEVLVVLGGKRGKKPRRTQTREEEGC